MSSPPLPSPPAVLAPPVAAPEFPSREFQELWFSLATRRWGSIVLVPVGAGMSAAVIASELAEVGRLLGLHVTASLCPHLDYATAAELTSRLAAKGPGQIIVAIPGVVGEPLGVAVAQAADATVLCIERGQTRIADVRWATEMIGRERILGCFLVG
jgi:hypothetical protein